MAVGVGALAGLASMIGLGRLMRSGRVGKAASRAASFLPAFFALVVPETLKTNLGWGLTGVFGPGAGAVV